MERQLERWEAVTATAVHNAYQEFLEQAQRERAAYERALAELLKLCGGEPSEQTFEQRGQELWIVGQETPKPEG